MGELVLRHEKVIATSGEDLFERSAADRSAGWLFGATCEAVREGAVVGFDIPLVERFGGGIVRASGRIVRVERGRRLVLSHEIPWRGTIECTLRLLGGEATSVRLAEDAVHWLLGAPAGMSWRRARPIASRSVY